MTLTFSDALLATAFPLLVGAAVATLLAFLDEGR